MSFKLPKFIEPNFRKELFLSAPNIRVKKVKKEGVAPHNFHILSVYPEYFKIKGKWVLANESRMDCVAVITKDLTVEAVEFRNLNIGDLVVVGRNVDASEGIYLHYKGFIPKDTKDAKRDIFSFRTEKCRETSFSQDYDRLCELLNFEKNHGYIVWVLGPAVVFDYNSRKSLSSLIKKEYVHSILAGNALATHDLEGSLFKTALGQNIYTQRYHLRGHYNHLDVLNKARRAGSISKFLENENIKDGVVYWVLKRGIPFVLAGSIRDDGPLPQVIADVYVAQDSMRKQIKKATTIICLATQLHTIASGNMSASYVKKNGKIRPVYIYNVDITEFAVNKLRNRGTSKFTPIITNVQDFLVLLNNRLI